MNLKYLFSRSEKLLPVNISGFVAALCAYVIWGLFPLYMKAVSHIFLMEILAHRVLWSIPIALVVLIVAGRINDLWAAMKKAKIVAMACLTSTLISVNWSIYIWAIAHDHAVDAALGYYINPLFNVMLGLIFLRERLNLWQWFAVGLAVIAVLILTINAGGLPWVAVLLPFTFSFYVFFRKSLPVGPTEGFALETLILFVPALIIAGYFIITKQDHFIDGSWSDVGLLIMAGPFTAVPFILFAVGAKTLNLTTLGLMHYSTPTFLFLIAIFVFHEPFSTVQLAAFSLIWLGLIIYTGASFSTMLRSKNKETIIELEKPPRLQRDRSGR